MKNGDKTNKENLIYLGYKFIGFMGKCEIYKNDERIIFLNISTQTIEMILTDLWYEKENIFNRYDSSGYHLLNTTTMSHTMKKHSEHQFKVRAGFKTTHHIRPRSRGGESTSSNLIQLDAYRHNAWHLLFSNLTIDEVITLLEKLKHIKESQRFRYLSSY